MVDLLERLPDNFEMITMQLRAKPLLEGEAGPFVVVALQVNASSVSVFDIVEDACFAVYYSRTSRACVTRLSR